MSTQAPTIKRTNTPTDLHRIAVNVRTRPSPMERGGGPPSTGEFARARTLREWPMSSTFQAQAMLQEHHGSPATKPASLRELMLLEPVNQVVKLRAHSNLVPTQRDIHEPTEEDRHRKSRQVCLVTHVQSADEVGHAVREESVEQGRQTIMKPQFIRQRAATPVKHQTTMSRSKPRNLQAPSRPESNMTIPSTRETATATGLVKSTGPGTLRTSFGKQKESEHKRVIAALRAGSRANKRSVTGMHPMSAT